MAKPKLYATKLAECSFRKQFWADNKWDVEWLEGEESQILQDKTAQAILISPTESLEWIDRVKKVPVEISRLEFVDSIWFEDGRYWPRSLHRDLIRDFVIRIAKTLDISAWAYITGANAWTQMFVMLISDIGYRKICLVGEDTEVLEKIVKKAQRYCFGVEFRILLPPDLTQEPNNGSLLVNTLDLDKEQSLLQTLLYLNFVHRPGLIMDVYFNGKISALLGEARQSGFEVISGVDIRALYDCAVLEKLQMEKQIPWPYYLASWRAFLGLMKPTSP